MTVKIDLEHFFPNDNPCVVIESDTGIIYSAQVGGMSCLHPEVEGFVLPFPGIWDNTQMILGDDHSDLCCDGDEERRRKWADLIDSCLKLDSRATYLKARFCYPRISQLTESWWPIYLACEKTSIWPSVSEFTETPAWIYSGTNCD